MIESDEPLADNVSLTVKLDESGLDIKGRSRLATALDRLTGNLFDIPATWLEGHAQKLRSKNAASKAMDTVEIEMAVARLRQHPAGGLRLLDIFLAEQERKQKNRDTVAVLAIEELKALPAPLSPRDDAGETSSDISEDWLNVLSIHAENASSDHLRSLWARILAGEVRQPGTFSLSTLRVVAELDARIATTFQKRIADRLLNGSLPLAKEDSSGQGLAELHFLEEVGLLSGVGSIGRSFEKFEDGYSYVQNGGYMLRIKSAKTGPLGLRTGLALITRAGRELATILPPEPDDRSLRAIAKILYDDAESMDLFKMTAPSSGDLIDTLRGASASSK